jgi:tetratricopeptide (TPR) repeat protein
MPKARQAARRALELDDTLGVAAAIGAQITIHHDRNWPAAEAEFVQALALNPNVAYSRALYSTSLMQMRRLDDALSEARWACELDPHSPFCASNLGNALYFMRRYDEALQQMKRALELEPGFGITHMWIGEIRLTLGHFEESIAAHERAVALTNESALALSGLARACVLAGQRRRAIEILDMMLKLSHERWVSPALFIPPYLALGEEDAALEHTRAACEGGEHMVLTVGAWPPFDPFRDSPCFREIERMVGLWD